MKTINSVARGNVAAIILLAWFQVMGAGAATVSAQDGLHEGREAPPVTVVKGDDPANVTREASAVDVPSANKRAENASRLVISSWPGAYGVAQDMAIISPFRNATTASVQVIRRRPAPAGDDSVQIPGDADVVELAGGPLAAACRRGEVMALGDVELKKGVAAQEPADDFVDEALGRCGIGNFMWSTLFVVNPESFKNGGPRTIRDVFDMRRFPGKRALIKDPRRLMEMALLADGVRAANIYAVLATDAGTRRAFRRLGSIRRQIVWLEKPGDGLALLAKGDVGIAMTYSGRAFRQAVIRQYRLIWDGSVREVSYWAVPRSARNPDAAKSFIRFATAPEQLAEQARIWPYGPVRRSSISLVGQHRYLPIDLKPYLPSAPGNLEKGMTVYAPFWSEHQDRIGKMFTAWVGGKLPVAKVRAKRVKKSSSRSRKNSRKRQRGRRR